MNKSGVWIGIVWAMCSVVLSPSIGRAQYHVSRYQYPQPARPGTVTATLVDARSDAARTTCLILEETILSQRGAGSHTVRYSLVNRPAKTFTVTSFRPIRADERYTVHALPVSVSLTGTTQYRGKYAVLTGQQVSPALTAPFPVKRGANGKPVVRWRVQGAGVFKAYPWLQQGSGKGCHVQVHTDEDWQTLSPGFFTRASGPVAIHCTATLELPKGALVKAPLPRITVAAEPLDSLKPVVSRWDIASGTTQEIKDKDGKVLGFGLSGIVDTPARSVGQRWTNVQIDVPAPFAGGLACFAEIVTPNHTAGRTVTDNVPAAPVYENLCNGVPGLAHAFPYWEPKHSLLFSLFDRDIVKPDYTWNVPNKNVPMGDAPEQGVLISDIDGGGNDWRRITASDTATTWVMYRPPQKDGQPTTYIPLMNYSWRWSGTLVKNAAGQWELTERFPENKKQTAITKAKQTTDTHPGWDLTHDLNPSLYPPVKR